MNRNFLATDLHGFSRIRQRQAACVFEFDSGRATEIRQNQAAERRNILAQDVSPGCGGRIGTESRRDGTALHHTLRTVWIVRDLDHRRHFATVIQF